MKRIKLVQISFMLLIAMIVVACAPVPITGRKQLTLIPSSQMLSLGTSSYQQVLNESELSDNVKYINLVRTVGYRISDAVEKYMTENGMSEHIKNYKWEYHVIKDNQLNAWCMPGGKIAFYEGIMPVCKDENGVAVVMAHEVAHAVAKHGNERMSQQLGLQLGGMALSQALKEKKETTQQLAMAAFGVTSQIGVMLPYSRLHESEADELGLYFMAMAGYDPSYSVEFWTRMQTQSQAAPPEFLSTHPNPNSRIRNLKRLIPKALKYYNMEK